MAPNTLFGIGQKGPHCWGLCIAYGLCIPAPDPLLSVEASHGVRGRSRSVSGPGGGEDRTDRWESPELKPACTSIRSRGLGNSCSPVK